MAISRSSRAARSAIERKYCSHAGRSWGTAWPQVRGPGELFVGVGDGVRRPIDRADREALLQVGRGRCPSDAASVSPAMGE